MHVQGCTRHCKDCFNQDTWDFDGGKPFTNELKQRFLDLGIPKKIVGFSILGGEPLQQGREMFDLLSDIRKTYDNKTIWMWTGYKYEDLSLEQLEIISQLDVLIDGEFVSDLKSPNRLFMGSHNQRVIDVKKTLETGTVTIFKFK